MSARVVPPVPSGPAPPSPGVPVVSLQRAVTRVSNRVQATFAKGTPGAAVVNLANTILGAGVLTMPFAMHGCGLAVGMAALVGVALLQEYSMRALFLSCIETGAKSYRDLVTRTHGSLGATALQTALIASNFGACVAYLIIMADLIVPVAAAWGHSAWWTTRPFLVTIMTWFIAFPLSTLRSINSLRISSSLALAALGSFVCLIIIWALSHEPDPAVEYAKVSTTTLRSLPLMFFAFTCHPNIFPTFRELDHQTAEVCGRVTKTAVSICLVIYSIVGILAYVAFASDVKGNVFLNFDPSNPSVSVIRLANAIAFALSFPLLALPLREAVHASLPDRIVRAGASRHQPLRNLSSPRAAAAAAGRAGDDELRASDSLHLAETAGIVGLAYLIVLVTPRVEFVFGLVGASATSLVCFVAPGLVRRHLAAPGEGDWRDTTLVFFGVVFGMLLGTYATLVSE